LVKLPIQISPNPLITTVIELRYITAKDPVNILGLVLSSFSNYFPKFSPNVIPEEVKLKNAQLTHHADYILQNDEFSIAFSKNVVIFENLKDYPLWDIFFSTYKKVMNQYLELGFIEKVTRVGVRFASVFDNNFDVSATFKYYPTFSIPQYEETLSLLNTVLKQDRYSYRLQVSPNAKVEAKGKQMSGIYIDIDAFFERHLDPIPKEIFRIIDQLHTGEKTLFFSLLKPDFISKLNPQY
jgi:uncharacterized protein (TIGR04255 family)